MNPEYILEQWRRFRESEINPSAPSWQLDDMEAAFYAGAIALLTTLYNDASTEELMVQKLDALRKELHRYAQKMNQLAGSCSNLPVV